MLVSLEVQVNDFPAIVAPPESLAIAVNAVPSPILSVAAVGPLTNTLETVGVVAPPPQAMSTAANMVERAVLIQKRFLTYMRMVFLRDLIVGLNHERNR